MSSERQLAENGLEYWFIYSGNRVLFFVRENAFKAQKRCRDATPCSFHLSSKFLIESDNLSSLNNKECDYLARTFQAVCNLPRSGRVRHHRLVSSLPSCAYPWSLPSSSITNENAADFPFGKFGFFSEPLFVGLHRWLPRPARPSPASPHPAPVCHTESW